MGAVFSGCGSGRLLVAVALGLGLVALGGGCLSPVVCFLPVKFLFCGVVFSYTDAREDANVCVLAPCL